MATDAIPEFTESEMKLVSQTLLERYGRMVPLQLAEAEVQLNPEGEDLTVCPTIYWEDSGAHFVVFKLAANRYQSQFFYNEAAQYATGRNVDDTLGDCVIALLQVQAEHEQQMKTIRSGMTRMEIGDDGYEGPLVI